MTLGKCDYKNVTLHFFFYGNVPWYNIKWTKHSLKQKLFLSLDHGNNHPTTLTVLTCLTLFFFFFNLVHPRIYTDLALRRWWSPDSKDKFPPMKFIQLLPCNLKTIYPHVFLINLFNCYAIYLKDLMNHIF